MNKRATIWILFVAAAAGMCRAQGGPPPRPASIEALPGRGRVGLPSAYYQQRRTAFWATREADNGAVVFLGDSITEGWRTLAADWPSLRVANRGISGDTSRGVLYRLKEDVLDLHPRAVVLLIGINDIASGAEPADVASNIREIVGRIRAAEPAAPIVVCHVMPWKPVPGRSPDAVVALNHLIDGLVIGRPRVAVCDTYGAFATPEGFAPKDLFPDQLHPNAAGHQVWRRTLEPVLARLGVTG